MTTNKEKLWYRIYFKLRLYQSHGTSFQELFSEVMTYSHSAFQAITPYGSWGDGGNDGWIPDEFHYFQVYGPSSDSPRIPVDAAKKAVEDFKKLENKWKTIKKYSFVFNDKFLGTPGPLALMISNLKDEKNLDYAQVMVAVHLLEKFMGLQEEHRQSILNNYPSDIPDFIDSRALGELLKFLADKTIDNMSYLNITAPDFEEKIHLNNLPEFIGLRLRNNSYRITEIDDFLQNNEIGLRQSISNEIKRLYKESINFIPNTDEDSPALRYFWMVNELVPPSVKNAHIHTKKAYEAAAELIIAKYFESCDAYEHPVDIAPTQAC